ncbi:MAG: archaellin/type IV pilin N-terminal domain-containing protein [Candidatus Pacearchaeota archaeon]
MSVSKKILNKKSKINKKAISELVSYVLLIVLAIAMAAVAYVFLKPYAEKPLPEEECPEAVNVVLENYSCNNKMFSFTLKNRGLFDVYGIKLKIINNSEGLQYDFWLYLPDCGGIQKCNDCNEDCLKVETDLKGDLDYSNFNKINELVIYPIKVINNNFYICSNAVIKVPLEGCN